MEQLLWGGWVWESLIEKERKLGFQIGFSYLEKRENFSPGKGNDVGKSSAVLVFFVVVFFVCRLHFPRESSSPGNLFLSQGSFAATSLQFCVFPHILNSPVDGLRGSTPFLSVPALISRLVTFCCTSRASWRGHLN